MMLRYAATATGLVVYLMLAWFLGSLLGLQGADLWLFRIGLALIGLMAALTCAWYIRRSQQEPPQEGSTPYETRSSGKVDSRLRDAAHALKGRHLKPLSRFPVLLVLGEPESGKTTMVVKSGMRPELLAGKDCSGPDVVPTESLNCWLVEGAIVIEPALAVQSVPSEWGSLIKRVTLRRLSGAAGPLAVQVCFPANALGGSRDSVIAAARKFRAQLASLAQAAGRQIPIYVIFTKLDLLKSFTEYIARFTDSEIDQLLGTPMPLAVDRNRYIHSDQIAKAVASRFDRLVAGLAGTRIDLLQRQREMKVDNDPKTLAAIYEFPREFKRIRDNAVQFLAELFIPGTASFGPFFRGFYFCGARLTPGSQPVIETSSRRDLSATVIVRSPSIEGRSIPSSSFRAGSASDQQWTFLSPIFDEILNDKQAAEVSQSDVGMSVRRKVMLAIAASLVLLIFVGMTVSFVKNHGLIAQVKEVAERVNAPGVNRAMQMSALDDLRKEIGQLDEYSEKGIPWKLRWGLYAGDQVREGAEKIYFHRFDRLLMDEVRKGITTTVASAGASLKPAESQETCQALKAYLMLTSKTSDRENVDSDFLAPYLTERWRSAPPSSSNTDEELAKRQFEFFAKRLKSEKSVAQTRDDGIVKSARSSLKTIGSGGHLYQLMLAKAGVGVPPVQFTTEVLTNSYVVPAGYTKAGWKAMQNAVKNPQSFSPCDDWVLGGEGESAKEISSKQAEEVFKEYVTEYISQWRQFVKHAQIQKFNDLRDAASRLMILSEGSSSPLLQFLFTVSDNTNQEELKPAFRAVQSVVKPDSPDNLVGPANMAYMKALHDLQFKVEKIVSSSPGLPNSSDLNEALAAASIARGEADLILLTLGRDPVEQLEKTVVARLRDPILMTEDLLKREKSKVDSAK